MPSSEKSVNEVRKSFLTYLTMEKSLSTVASSGNTVVKPPQKSRSTVKQPPVYDGPSLNPMKQSHSSRDFLNSSSDRWSTISSSNSWSILYILEVDQRVRRRSQWVRTMIHKYRPRNFTSSWGSTAGRAALASFLESLSAEMDQMPYISFITLRPRSRRIYRSFSFSSALTQSTTKVPSSSKKPRRLSTLTLKRPSSDTIEFLSAPNASRS